MNPDFNVDSYLDSIDEAVMQKHNAQWGNKEAPIDKARDTVQNLLFSGGTLQESKAPQQKSNNKLDGYFSSINESEDTDKWTALQRDILKVLVANKIDPRNPKIEKGVKIFIEIVRMVL